MKVGIIGTRGIPNNYGGFEQFAEYLSVDLVSRGHEVSVYNSSNHSYTKGTYKGVQLIHCYDPEKKMGTIGQFIYDFNCIRDARKRNFDVILQLGYTSSSIWHWLMPKKSIVLTNMDGLEWKRTKFSKKVQAFLRYAEKLAVNHSDFLVADSIGIQDYLRKKYNIDSFYIPYGAELNNDYDQEVLEEYNLMPGEYNMLVARLEPENNIETILDGVVSSGSSIPFVVIGKTDNKFGQYLVEKYSKIDNILFFGGVYNQFKLRAIRHFSNVYFHGHSVGGTNPSLVEAMADSCFVVAHDNVFNKSILENNAEYFSTSHDVEEVLKRLNRDNQLRVRQLNRRKIQEKYTWDKIMTAYEKIMLDITK